MSKRAPGDGVGRPLRLAFIVSHPIQYYAPLYRLLAGRDDMAVKVFFTWHAGGEPMEDKGFARPVMWDVPLTEGYEFELARNSSRDPGTHHFSGLSNPSLVRQVLAWRPDAVHVTGWAWFSHLLALRALKRRGICILFRGDSHLLDGRGGRFGWFMKRSLLSRVYAWPAAFLAAGKANRAYYRAFGVNEERLFDCPHSVDVARFAEPDREYESRAAQWRKDLGIGRDKLVILYAGKFEPKKNPLGLMDAVMACGDASLVLLMVGGGELQEKVAERAARSPDRLRLLPFQNQSRMPIVYRLGDLFVLPSSHRETWGLGVNEALASNRPVLVSDRVGCAADVVTPDCGRVFDAADAGALPRALKGIASRPEMLSDWADGARRRAPMFDIPVTAAATIACLKKLVSA
ncbi:MAG: glycosyltransferase family 4 protein [Rhizomicrobium sp.]